MKKVVSFLAVLAVVVMMSSAVFAVTFSTNTALASFEDAGSVEFSAQLYKFTGAATEYSAPEAVDSITWDVSDIALNSDEEQWKTSQVYCLIKSTITTAGGRVVIYQDNANNDDDYKATATGTKAGLVKKGSGGGEGNILDFQYMSVKFSSATTYCVTAQPNFQRTEESSWSDPYGSRGFKDLSDITTTPSAADLDYITIANNKGIWDGNTFFNKGDNVLFFAATFKNILGRESYGTQTIKFSTQVE